MTGQPDLFGEIHDLKPVAYFSFSPFPKKVITNSTMLIIKFLAASGSLSARAK
jgi:hypothetical protein